MTATLVAPLADAVGPEAGGAQGSAVAAGPAADAETRKRELHAELRGFVAQGGDSGDFARFFARTGVTEEELRAVGYTCWGDFEADAGVHPRVSNTYHSPEAVLADVHRVAMSLGRFPRASEYEWGRRIGSSAHRRRFGDAWAPCRRAYFEWLVRTQPGHPFLAAGAPSSAASGTTATSSAVATPPIVVSSVATAAPPAAIPPADVSTAGAGTPAVSATPASATAPPARTTAPRPLHRYPRTVIAPTTIGRPLDDEVMRYEPTNELGVILLLGRYAEELGLSVVHISQGFPDVLMTRWDPARGAHVLAAYEIELRSRAYREHGHDRDPRARQTAGVICWVHDAQSLPKELEVIELRSLIAKLRGDAR